MNKKPRLITFENKVLQRTYGPVEDGGVWQVRKNRELRLLYMDTDII